MSAPSDITYSGSCHCGQVKYQVDLPPDPTTWELTRCNCTICHKKGYLSMYPKDVKTFTLVSPASMEEVGNYKFGSLSLNHQFCKNCGTNVFGHGWIDATGRDHLIINAYTLDDVDLSKTKARKYWDGRAEKWTEGPGPEPVAPGQW
ncbi:Mss4-like protein [Tirmania nivea]|nr:Mss4-like protein [Tirmania nivea]